MFITSCYKYLILKRSEYSPTYLYVWRIIELFDASLKFALVLELSVIMSEDSEVIKKCNYRRYSWVKLAYFLA